MIKEEATASESVGKSGLPSRDCLWGPVGRGAGCLPAGLHLHWKITFRCGRNLCVASTCWMGINIHTGKNAHIPCSSTDRYQGKRRGLPPGHLAGILSSLSPAIAGKKVWDQGPPFQPVGVDALPRLRHRVRRMTGKCRKQGGAVTAERGPVRGAQKEILQPGGM